jgi:hypothetical protein
VANTRQDQEAVPPGAPPNVPSDLSPGAGQTRILIEALENSLKDVKDDLREIKNHRHSDFVHMIELFGAGFVLLAGMLIAGYFVMDGKYDKVNEKIDKLSTTATRADAKLEDLLARIPPAPTLLPAPRRP